MQKQSQRALAKLARILRGRGVTLTATAIAAGLSTELVKAAPAQLLQSATTAVLTGTASYSTTGLTLMLAAKSKALIPLVILLFAVPLALQQIAISTLQTHNSDLRANLQLASHHTSASRLASTSVRKSGVSTNTDILVLYDEQKEALRQGRSAADAFAHKLAALEPETLVKLIREGAALRVNRDSKVTLLKSLVSALAGNDRRLAVTTVMDLLASDRAAANAFIGVKALPDHFVTWAEADPEGAKTWLEGLEQSGDFNDPHTVGGMFAAVFRGRLVGAMMSARSPGLREYLLTRPESERSGLVGESVFSLCRFGGPSAASGCASAIPLIREFVPESQRDDALKRMVSNMGGGILGDAYSTVTPFFEIAELTPSEEEVIARTSAQLTLGMHRTPFDPAVGARVSAETDAFLRKVIPLQADRVLAEVTAQFQQKEMLRAENIIKDLQSKPQASDDDLIRELTDYDLRSQLPEALKFAERIKEPVKRAATMDKLNQRR